MIGRFVLRPTVPVANEGNHTPPPRLHASSGMSMHPCLVVDEILRVLAVNWSGRKQRPQLLRWHVAAEFRRTGIQRVVEDTAPTDPST